MTIVFVNLVFKDQDKAEVIGSAIQDASVHINSVLRDLRGQINKVFMFDKVGGNQGVAGGQHFEASIRARDGGERKGTDTSPGRRQRPWCGPAAFSAFGLCERISASGLL